MANVKRLIELGMPTELAKEVAAQIESAVPASLQAAIADPAAYSTVAADISAALVTAGLMEEDD